MARSKRVAYLVNQYPSVSQTFIRREIAAVEQSGEIEVVPYSLRHSTDGFVDSADRTEALRTHVVEDSGAVSKLAAALELAFRAPHRFFSAAVTTLRMGWKSDRGLHRNFAYFFEATMLVKSFRFARVEHVHAHFGTKAAAVAMLCRALGGPPYSFTIHGPLEFELARLLYLKQKIAGAEFVIAISDFCRSQIWRQCHIEDRCKVHVVTCGVDAEFLDKEPEPIPSAPRLVFVGRLSRQKCPEILLEAIARICSDALELDLTFVGDGELRPELEAMILREGLGDRVRIVGYCDEATVRMHIRKSRALVLPSYSEGLPVVLMEAFALGRPVVSTYIAGIPELVEAGTSGWLVPASSVDQLTEALREVVQASTDRLAAMGNAGRSRAMERHNVINSGNALVRLFRDSKSFEVARKSDSSARE